MAIYLDNSATTRVREEVVDAMLPFLGEQWGNASSLHANGKAAKRALNTAREQVANFLRCRPEEVFFSACGTNSNNVALLGRARFLEANNMGKHLITTQIEHPSVLGPAKYLESRGWQVTYLPVNKEGLIELEQFRKAFTPATSMVSVIWGNNEIGTVQAIQAMAEIANEKDIYFHTDAVQLPGKLAIDLSKVPACALSLSGHKFYAPKGTGILFLRSGVNVMPIEFGGGQEKGIFPGTEGVANIVAIGKAAQLAGEELADNQALLVKMQTTLIAELANLPNIRITGPTDLTQRLPGHVSFVVPGVEGEALVLRLDVNGLCVSSGSACHQGVIEPSQVLRAIGLSNHEAMGSVRVSFGKYNSMEDCQTSTEKLVGIISAIKGAIKVPSALA
jgi:cysteine desulfurase